jgi:hypothetical protein
LKRILALAIGIAVCAVRVGTSQAPAASIQSLAFLSGTWTEDSPDGHEEEYWSKPIGSSIVGTYRVVKDGSAVFYEFWAIESEASHLVFKMKHFNQGLVGWEEKADMVRLTTSVSGPHDVLFSNADGSLTLRYQRSGEELTSTLRRTKDGKTKEDVFHLHRLKSADPS